MKYTRPSGYAAEGLWVSQRVVEQLRRAVARTRQRVRKSRELCARSMALQEASARLLTLPCGPCADAPQTDVPDR